MSRPPLYWSRRLVRPAVVVVGAGLIAPFALHPLLGPGADKVLGYVGIIAVVVAIFVGPCLALPLGIITASLGRVETSVLTVQTLRGPRSVDLGRLDRVGALLMFGQRSSDTVFWTLSDDRGGRVTFYLLAGSRPPFIADLRAAVLALASRGGQQPNLRVRKELQLDEAKTLTGVAGVAAQRLVTGLLQYLALIVAFAVPILVLIGLYSLAGIPIS